MLAWSHPPHQGPPPPQQGAAWTQYTHLFESVMRCSKARRKLSELPEAASRESFTGPRPGISLLPPLPRPCSRRSRSHGHETRRGRDQRASGSRRDTSGRNSRRENARRMAPLLRIGAAMRAAAVRAAEVCIVHRPGGQARARAATASGSPMMCLAARQVSSAPRH